MLRFLQGLKFNNEETHRVINDHFTWANNAMPFSITPVEDLIKRGVVYSYKRDRGHRPIVIINVERLLESKVPCILS